MMRTLGRLAIALTLIFREMPELIEAGYIYIAKPPLYKIKRGNQVRYIERESELEEILLSDKWDKFQITDRDGKPFSITETRWQKFGRLVKQYEGWAAALRAEHGNDIVTFLEESAILDESVAGSVAAIELIGRAGIEGSPYETSMVDEDELDIVVRAVETRTGLARTLRMRRSLFDQPEYKSLVRVHQELLQLAGIPPFSIVLGDVEEEALSFAALRPAVLRVAQKGVTMSRFKGLGEMNADQLGETTMNPATRTLAKVNVEDAAEADRIFSMLMGDQVEPRREFIETNARLVANLDV